MPTLQAYKNILSPPTDPDDLVYNRCMFLFDEPDVIDGKPAPHMLWPEDIWLPLSQRPQRVLHYCGLFNVALPPNVSLVGGGRIPLFKRDVQSGDHEVVIDGVALPIPRMVNVTYGYWDPITQTTVLYDTPHEDDTAGI